MPNGLVIKHANVRETMHLYQDIFEKRIYVQHGIALPDHSVVIDAGANIGLFTLFILQNCPTASIHAFEPAPNTFERLRANTSSHGTVEISNCGLGSQMKDDLFVYLPNATAGSGFYDRNIIPKMKERLRHATLSDQERSQPYKGSVGEELLDYVLDDLFTAEVVRVPVRTLSSYIDERQIRHISLLKIDVEGKECAVLSGIRDDHWPLIEQVVIETHEAHSGVSSLPEILNTLNTHGYSVQSLPEDGLLTNIVYARRLT